MPLRLLEIIIPESNNHNVRELIEDEAVIGFWQEESSETGLLVKMLLSVEHTEKVLDLLEQKFSGMDGFRVVLLPVEATIPRIEEKKTENPESEIEEQKEEAENNILRISREELHSDIVDSTKFTNTFVAMVLLSAIVAAVGLLHDNVAIVIGAMVIAPLLGPNVALALATTLGDFELGYNALKTSSLGVVMALGLSIFIGYFFNVDPAIPQIASRTSVGLSDIILALASGIAGVLAFTSGASISLIGVMVAVALLPPLITLGLLVGSGNLTEALGALLLLVTNIICVNLAGVTTFLVQGIRPRKWWEASKAKKATRTAITLWSVLLAILIAVIIFSQRT
jgi:uncharacterized hydrophobic protein (TIGR00341 family)